MTRKIIRPKPKATEADKACQLNTLWCELEETMGEGAAYNVACSQLGIDPDDGYDLLAEHSGEINRRVQANLEAQKKPVGAFQAGMRGTL